MSYRFMRMLVMFDMPTETANDRKAYRQFRKFLINEGFIMHQFSVYTKILLNNTPKNGHITALTVTEKQFSRMIYLSGTQDKRVAQSDQRLIFLGDDYADEIK